MKFSEIMEKVESGEIVQDFCGHKTHEWHSDRLHRIVRLANGAGDGTWNYTNDDKTHEETDAFMREYHQMAMDRDYPENKPITGIAIEPAKCSVCGELLYWNLSGDKLSLNSTINYSLDLSLDAKVEQIERCRLEKALYIAGEIKVDSLLVFSNYFNCVDDAPKDEEFDEEWSLNHTAGRAKIALYKAERNVAYGQMGNMSVGVFISKDERSIIIGDPYNSDNDDDREEIDGHKLMGEIDCVVWRWEAAAINTIQADYKNARERGTVELDVPHGVWEFKHYYRIAKHPENPVVYATMKLKS